MKLRHAAALALLLLASCAPNTGAITKATSQAENAAKRAELSATDAEQASTRAFEGATQAAKIADDAETDAQRANNSVARMEFVRPPFVEGDPYYCEHEKCSAEEKQSYLKWWRQIRRLQKLRDRTR
jgi:hypothetical protein